MGVILLFYWGYIGMMEKKQWKLLLVPPQPNRDTINWVAVKELKLSYHNGFRV